MIMFDNVRMLSSLAGLMKNKDGLKQAGERVRAKMEATRVTGVAGGGAARATVTGTMRVLEVELSPALVMGMAGDPKTHQLAGSLIAEAVNAGIKEAQAKMQQAVSEEAKALGLPEMPELAGMFGMG
jgi:DNA-binding protein YbaB